MKARLTALLRGTKAPVSPWRPENQNYPALTRFDPAIVGAHKPGLYALWHLGVRPRWVRVGGAVDLAAALARVKDVAEIHATIVHGGVYVAWAFVATAEIPATLDALATVLQPFLQGLDLPGEVRPARAVATAFPLPPGTGDIVAG